MSTPHISAELGDFAKTVLLPGDPLRAQFIAKEFLEDVKEVNGVRGMLGFTGTYKGHPVSVMGSGMGMPSMGIYSWELFNVYDVDNIIRIGSAGSMQSHVGLYDIVIAASASTNSNFMMQYNLPGTYAPTPAYDIVEKLVANSKKNGANYHIGNVLSNDLFYDFDSTSWKKWAKLGVLAVEMEAAALFLNAAASGKKAACLLTISDSLVTGESTSSTERQVAFKQMMEIALETAIQI